MLGGTLSGGQAVSRMSRATPPAMSVPNVCGHGSTRKAACRSLSQRGNILGGSKDLLGNNSGSGLILGPGTGRPPGKAQKLVLPGSRPSNAGGRLIIPDKNIEKILAEGAAALGPEVVTPTGPSMYRPPAGFMDDEIKANEQLEAMTPDGMLNKLRSRTGRWHYLAKMLPYLLRAGYDSSRVDEMTGITPLEQSRWAVGATVYDSLVDSGVVPEEVMSKFDANGTDAEGKLGPFRFLPQDMRVEAALYIVLKNLDATACDLLARSMKEWERRVNERQRFTSLPGDCLAFKYLRDAFECRRLEDAESFMEKALDTAVTDPARERLREASAKLRTLYQGSISQTASGSASLSVLRLDPEEIGFRPIPMLGVLGQATLLQLTSAPSTSQEGAFGTFTISGQGAACNWVALPQWKPLAMMRLPIALFVADCSAVQAILLGTKAKTEDDRRRLIGPALVVAERSPVGLSDLQEDTFYLAPVSEDVEAKLALVDGSQLKSRGIVAVATVAFLARPPAREHDHKENDNQMQI